MRGSRWAGVVAAVAVAALLAGCAPGASGGAPASPVATTDVRLPPSYRFAPAAITVAAGSTVTWTNDDHFTHSVQLQDPALPSDAMLMEPGQSVTYTFDLPGTYAYRCSLHPRDMRGTVTVTP